MRSRATTQAVALACVLFQHLAGVSFANDAPEPPTSADRTAESIREFQTQVGDRVFFSEGSAVIGTRARLALTAQADWLVRHPSLELTVEGHADESGADNVQISSERANAVRRRLIESGVATARIRVVAYGRAQPVADCADAACAAQNRRVVTVLRSTAAAVPSSDIAAPREDSPRRSPRRLF